MEKKLAEETEGTGKVKKNRRWREDQNLSGGVLKREDVVTVFNTTERISKV